MGSNTLTDIEQATQINPDDAGAWFNLGNIHDEAKEYAKAIEAYGEATRCKPDFAKAWLNLGNAYSKTKQYEKAINAYQMATGSHPDLANANTCFIMGSNDGAWLYQDDKYDAWLNLAKAYDETKEYAKAIESYEKTIRINPDNAYPWRKLGNAYTKTEQYYAANDAYKGLMKHLNSRFPDIHKGIFRKLIQDILIEHKIKETPNTLRQKTANKLKNIGKMSEDDLKLCISIANGILYKKMFTNAPPNYWEMKHPWSLQKHGSFLFRMGLFIKKLFIGKKRRVWPR